MKALYRRSRAPALSLARRSIAAALLTAVSAGAIVQSGLTTAAIVTDGEGIGANSFQTAVWDTTPPTATALLTVNGGSKNGKAEVDDQIIIWFSEPIDTASIKAGWDGSATEITATLQDNVAAYDGKDIVTFDVNLGVINLGSKKYTKGGDSVFEADMAWNVQSLTLTVTFTDLEEDNVKKGNKKTATFYPDPGIQDTGRNLIDTSATPTIKDKHF